LLESAEIEGGEAWYAGNHNEWEFFHVSEAILSKDAICSVGIANKVSDNDTVSNKFNVIWSVYVNCAQWKPFFFFSFFFFFESLLLTYKGKRLPNMRLRRLLQMRRNLNDHGLVYIDLKLFLTVVEMKFASVLLTTLPASVHT